MTKRIYYCVTSLLILLGFSPTSYADSLGFCGDIMPAAIQSHSPNGEIFMGYKSRVHGSGSTLVAPTVRHSHSWQDQVGLCDGVKCQATGTNTQRATVDFLTGTRVPTQFEYGNAELGNRSNGYRTGTLSLAAGNYGDINVGQESVIRFSSVGAVYKTRAVTTNFRSAVEFSPGDYWIDGDLNLTAQNSVIRLVNSSSPTNKVRLFVSGNVRGGQIHVEGFSHGQIELYAWGNVTLGNDFYFPGEIHALGEVGFGMRPRITGGIYANTYATGNEARITYSRLNTDHHLGTLKPAFNSVFELSPGNYWINGDFEMNVRSTIRKINGPGTVRLFVKGNINLKFDAAFEGFSGGELILYATGNVTIESQKDLPAFIYADGDVSISFNNSRFLGNIVGRNITIGQESTVEYIIPQNLEPFCSSSPVVNAINYHLNHPLYALTCNPIEVGIEARDNNGNLISGDTTVTLAPDNIWIGGNTISFTGGSTTVLMRRIAGSYHLGISSASPSMNSLTCSTSDCGITLYDSGFVLDIPNLIAGRTDTAQIQALRTGTNEECIPGFAEGAKIIEFQTAYNNPQSGTDWPEINSQSVTSTPQATSLYFDASATATFTIRYDDVGALDLTATYAGESEEDGLVMEGSDVFITRPHTLAIQRAFISDNGSTRENQGTTNSGNGFAASGEPFNVTIESRNYFGYITPNFGLETPRQLTQVEFPESERLIYPSAGNEGELTPGSLNTEASVSVGQQQIDGIRWNEAGTIALRARLTNNNYLNSGDVLQKPLYAVGRFYPDYFYLRASSVLDGCSAAAPFTYMGQPAIDYMFRLEAHGVEGNTLHNYHDNYPYEGTAIIDPVLYYSATGQPFANTAERWSPDIGSWVHGVYAVDQTNARFNRLTTDVPDGPYDLQAGLTIASELDNRTFSNEAANNDGTALLNGAIHPRYGRLILDNIAGPEDADLFIQGHAEYWNGTTFVRNYNDSCSQINLSQFAPTPNGGNPQFIEKPSSMDVLNNGVIPSVFAIAGPGQAIEYEFEYDVPPYLQFNWQDEQGNSHFNPRALATFGQFRGNDRIIIWMEQW